MARIWLLGCIAALVLGCGHHSGSDSDSNGPGDDANGGGDDALDAYIRLIDAPPFSGMCNATSGAQCANCNDDDSDGKIDGFDPECSGPLDDDESSFATGIPGDNMDATWQDCFFDGDSGGGNDGCNQHVCCLLKATDINSCKTLAPNSHYKQYVQSECYKPFGTVDVPALCAMNCGPLAPPGCDCFGCCTVCNGTTCRDIAINPSVSPNCDQNNISDKGPDGIIDTADDPCKSCQKSTCGGSTTCSYDTATCAATNSCCTPCPGQCDSATPPNCNPPLPASCSGTTSCPNGLTACNPDGSCTAAGTYCSSGCCVGQIL